MQACDLGPAKNWVGFTSGRPVTNEGRAMEAGPRCPGESPPGARAAWQGHLNGIPSHFASTVDAWAPHKGCVQISMSFFKFLCCISPIGSSVVRHKEPQREVSFTRKLPLCHCKFSWGDQEMERQNEEPSAEASTFRNQHKPQAQKPVSWEGSHKEMETDGRREKGCWWEEAAAVWCRGSLRGIMTSLGKKPGSALLTSKGRERRCHENQCFNY